MKTATTKHRKKKTTVYGSETIYKTDENGELQPIPATIIDEEWDEEVDLNFDKIWLGEVMKALEQVGNKKIKVANYIINNRDRMTNYLIQTQREIAEICEVSLQTVSATLKALESADLIVGKSGIYQVNPDRIAYGKHNKRMAILRIYRQTKDSKTDTEQKNKPRKKKEKMVLDPKKESQTEKEPQIPGQLSVLEEGA